MKLSEIRGDRVFDVIADIIDPIANIATSESAAVLFKREKCPDGMTPKAFMAQRIRKALPSLLKAHKADIIAILSSIEGVSAEAYTEALNLAKLMQDTAELLTDEAFGELFVSAQSGISSGSAPGSTEEAKE